MLEEKKFYLTKKGLEKTKKEYKQFKEIRLAKARGELPRLLHSEELNPEYLSFQEDLSFLDERIADLKNVLRNVEIISFPPKDKQSIIALGASVLVETDDGQIDEFKIVGSLEANPFLGVISNESPVGMALLGHKVKDKVVVQSSIKTIYKIKNISY